MEETHLFRRKIAHTNSTWFIHEPCEYTYTQALTSRDNAVEDAVRYSAVPGMGMFDVDGLEDAEDRAGGGLEFGG